MFVYILKLFIFVNTHKIYMYINNELYIITNKSQSTILRIYAQIYIKVKNHFEKITIVILL